MNKVVSKRQFSENVVGLDIEAPRIAKARRAGHFVMVRVDEKGERIPLTISSADVQRGTITLVIQKVGAHPHFLNQQGNSASLHIGRRYGERNALAFFIDPYYYKVNCAAGLCYALHLYI